MPSGRECICAHCPTHGTGQKRAQHVEVNFKRPKEAQASDEEEEKPKNSSIKTKMWKYYLMQQVVNFIFICQMMKMNKKAAVIMIIYMLLVVACLPCYNKEYQVCGISKSGHAIGLPREVECKPPVKNDDKPFRVNITVYVPRTKPIVANAYKCWKRERQICTFNSFFGAKSILEDRITVKPVEFGICKLAYMKKR